MAELKDRIDFGREDVRVLFNKVFYPTLLGMVFSIVFNITDGIFVGRGIGSLALAAVNVVAPVFMISGGISLMLGMGGSVVASIHLSKDNLRTARMVATQSVGAAVVSMAVFAAVLLLFPTPILRFFGCSDTMMGYAADYLKVFAPFAVVNGIILASCFFIRLDGAPKYAMAANIVGALLNIFLDWLFIFPFQWGLHGAALATGIAMSIESVVLLVYMFHPGHKLHFAKVKVSTLRAWMHTLRNCGYMCKLGFSTMLAQLAVALMVICGNNIFVRISGDSGVAAFSVVCYLSPIVFMVYDAIAVAAQPIQSYNYGAGSLDRSWKALKLALVTGIGYGAVVVLMTTVFARPVASLFIEASDPAHDLAVEGMRLFSIGFIPMAISIVTMGFFQSVEKVRQATVISTLRGFVLMLICFFGMTLLWGEVGAWLAIPASETLTMCVTIALLISYRRSVKF